MRCLLSSCQHSRCLAVGCSSSSAGVLLVLGRGVPRWDSGATCLVAQVSACWLAGCPPGTRIAGPGCSVSYWHKWQLPPRSPLGVYAILEELNISAIWHVGDDWRVFLWILEFPKLFVGEDCFGYLNFPICSWVCLYLLCNNDIWVSINTNQLLTPTEKVQSILINISKKQYRKNLNNQ